MARRLRECDLVVAEGAAARYAPVQRLVSRFRLGTLVDQVVALDLESLGVPIIWPEGEPLERLSLWQRILLGVAEVPMLFRGRFTFPSKAIDIEESFGRDHLWAGSRATQRRNRWMLSEHDAELTERLHTICDDRRREPIVVAVVYGAAHMTAVTDYLCNVLGYRPAGADWITVRNSG